MELSLQQRRKALLSKIPDIEQTLTVVRFLRTRRRKALGEEISDSENSDIEDSDELSEEEEEGEGSERKGKPKLKTLFELNDTLYAEAELEETDEVGIWLGANTMLMYPLAEAEQLLSDKLSAAKQSLKEVIEDLEWIREQVTVMEVNFARVHNWDVKRRRELKALSGTPTSALLTSGRKGEDSEDEKD
ncbi:prefoldin subunit [Tremella mesenterica]|uniref:Prefoldin subunit 3 n=1 Tax=Tremella mesenterica TaxID=5217 RepID=A0A4Q1BJD5_TREME|nr:prefoldin subunit [Tremella mesenterica]